MKTDYSNLYLSIDDRDIMDELNKLEESSNAVHESISAISDRLSATGFTNYAIARILTISYC
jgi:hypothetical protein